MTHDDDDDDDDDDAVSSEHVSQSHVTYGVVDKSCDGIYSLRCLKQKQFVDGIGYLLQEIYGIENKNTERAKVCSTRTHELRHCPAVS